MEIVVQDVNNVKIAELADSSAVITTAEEVLEFMVNAGYLGADNIIIRQDQLTPDFFDLKTGVAGEILQKFSNYRMRLAITGDFSKYKSKSLKDFIYESNKSGRVMFVNTADDAKQLLSNFKKH